MQITDCRHTIEISLTFYRDLVNILLRFRQHFIEILLIFYRDLADILNHH